VASLLSAIFFFRSTHLRPASCAQSIFVDFSPYFSHFAPWHGSRVDFYIIFRSCQSCPVSIALASAVMMSASRCADVCRYLTLYCVHIINFQIIVKYSGQLINKLSKKNMKGRSINSYALILVS